MITATQLTDIMPHCPRPAEYAKLLSEAMREFGIDNVARGAAFLGQLAHESGEFRWLEEHASGASYEGRKDLGNRVKGDGVRYKGRGPIMLTGRANYAATGLALGLPLEAQPELLLDPRVGFRVAAWWWAQRGLNGLADRGEVTAITRVVNGGYNGLEARIAYSAKAAYILGAAAPLF